jgi:FtsP/CotA-like multicopper oxidase with cupredoxin domain
VGGTETSRRHFLRLAGTVAGAKLVPSGILGGHLLACEPAVASPSAEKAADYVLRIGAAPIEIAPHHIVSAIVYNGQFPGPLLRFKEGQTAIIDVHNDTDTPEQLHWHGQFVSSEVDGAAEEGTPFIPAHGMRRIAFAPRPTGFRFYHTHNRAGPTFMPGSTADKSVRSTSNLSTNPGATIAKYFLY